MTRFSLPTDFFFYARFKLNIKSFDSFQKKGWNFRVKAIVYVSYYSLVLRQSRREKLETISPA